MEAFQVPCKITVQDDKTKKGDGNCLLRHAQDYLVDITHSAATTNAGHFQGALTVFEECVGCQNEYCCCIMLPNHMLLTPL